MSISDIHSKMNTTNAVAIPDTPPSTPTKGVHTVCTEEIDPVSENNLLCTIADFLQVHNIIDDIRHLPRDRNSHNWFNNAPLRTRQRIVRVAKELALSLFNLLSPDDPIVLLQEVEAQILSPRHYRKKHTSNEIVCNMVEHMKSLENAGKCRSAEYRTIAAELSHFSLPEIEEMQSSHMTEEKSQSQPQSKNGEKESMFSRKIYQELVEIYFDLLRDK